MNNKSMKERRDEIVKFLCFDFSIDFYDLQESELEDINAYLYSPKEVQRGFGGFIVDDEGNFLTIGSLYPLNHYIEEFKNIYRNSNVDVKGIIEESIEKIEQLSLNETTTIAELIDYNPNNYNIEPMIQGIILNRIEKECENKKILLERDNDYIGGLPFYVKLKKIDAIDNNLNHLKRGDFINCASEYMWKQDLTKETILEVLNKYEKELATHYFEKDKSFVMDGRRIYMVDRVDELAHKDEQISLDDPNNMIWSFWEFINEEYYSPAYEELKKHNISIEEAKQLWNNYKNKGIICLQEKEIIQEMINNIKSYINKINV